MMKMTPLGFFLLVCLLISHSSFLIVKGDEPLILQACQGTVDFHLCVRSLKSNPKSQTADVHGLATIITNRSKNYADEAYSFTNRAHSFVSGLLARADPKETELDNLFRQCADLYMDSRTALQAALASLGSHNYRAAYLHLSAAIGYTSKCRKKFIENSQFSYPSDMAIRERTVKQLCGVAMGIINGLF